MKIYNFIIKAVSTCFFLGYLPLVPGTFGSLLGLLLFCLIRNNIVVQLGATILITIAGFIVCGRAEELFNRKDPKYIVIDEVAGMLIALLFIPYDFRILIIGFVLFRILDAIKPYPLSGLQKLKGSLGVMSDDIIAGLYTNALLQLVLRFSSFRIS